MPWHRSVEVLLQKMCDEAQVRESLHRKGYYFYKGLNSWFQLPIIILSAASGSIQFLSKSFPDVEDTIVTCTGSVSILVSIISAVMTYLKLGENKNKHEISAGAWQAFYNTVSHQLNLAPELREDADKFLGDVKSQYDRLHEISPICNHSFIQQVKSKISSSTCDEFQVPFYMNGMRHTSVWDADDEYEDNSFGDEVQPDVPVV